MAEIFKNFVGTLSGAGKEFILVPSGISGQNEKTYNSDKSSNKYNVRDVDSDCQIHSIYVSQINSPRISGSERYNPKNFKSVDIYIKDTNDEDLKIYVAYDVRIVPGSPFYIEKNITLEPSQYLCAYCDNNVKDLDINNNNSLVAINSNVNLHFTTSVILFKEDELN